MSEEENYLENEEDDNEYKPIFNNEGEENKNDDDKLKNNFGNTQSKISKKESEMSKNDNIFLPQVNNSQQSSKKSENKDEMFMENEEVDDVQFKNDVNNEEMKKNEDENSENKEEMFVDNEEVDDVQFKNDVNNEEKSKNSFEEVKKSNLNDNKSNLSSKKSENKSKVSSKKDNESEKKSKLSSKKDNESEKKSKLSSNKNNEEEKKSNLSDKKSNKSSKKNSNLEKNSQIENQKENEIPLNNSKLNLKKSSKKHLSNKSQLQNPIKNPNFLEISQNSSHHTFNLPIIPIKDNSLNKSTNSKLNNKSKISTPKNNINNDQDFLPKIIEPNINNKNINEINSENNKINSENNKINSENNKINDDILIINKQEKTNEPLETCNICGYVDTKSEFTKQTLKLEHLKHLLIPEITKIVQNQLEEYDKKRKEEESKKDPPIDYTEKLNQLESMLISLATATKSLQANFGINPDNSEQQAIDIINKSLKRKLKNMNKIATLAHNVDNSFETDNKFTITHTFKQEYLIIYPNLNYGIDEFNLSSNLKKTVVSNAHESNIICMKTCQNNKKNLTYLASASYDRKLKIFSVENGYKLIKEFKDVHKDYSIFALDMIYDENDGVIILSGNSNTNEIKICFVDDDNNNDDDKKSNNSKKSNKSNKSKKSNNNNNIKTLAIDGKLFCINHNEKISDKFFVGTNKGIIIYKLKTLEIEKIICEKDDVSNHLCICFLKNINNILIEGNNLGKIKIWDLESNELIKNIERGILKNQVNSIDYWSDEYVIAGYRDGKIILIDVNNGKAIDEIGSHESYVYTVKTAEHWKYGKIIVSSGFDKKLKLFGNVSDE